MMIQLIISAFLLCTPVYSELMCGPRKDIPCSLYGCGDKNEEGIYGQFPCEKYYPRTCDFTFRSAVYDYDQRVIDRNITKFEIPAISEFKGKAIKLNDVTEDPIIYRKTYEEISACNITKIEYVRCIKDMDFYNIDCTLQTKYPSLHDKTAKSRMKHTIPLEGLFEIYGEGGGKEISVNPISNLNAVSLYSALRNTSTVLTLECAVPSSMEVIESCLLFELVPTNESPSLALQDPEILNPAFRFANPPVPALTFQNVTNGTTDDDFYDVVMNTRNPITILNGGVPPFCQGEITEYQGEEGSWYSVFLGGEGYYFDFDHILYVDGQYIYSATIQKVWAGLEATVAGRNLRMMVECLTKKGRSVGKGYLYFGTTYAPWDGEKITCNGRKASKTFCDQM